MASGTDHEKDSGVSWHEMDSEVTICVSDSEEYAV